MTPPDINARREMLAEEMKREIGHCCPDLLYDRIHAGDWIAVIKSLRRLVFQDALSCGRGFVRLAKHARDYPGEENLMLPLLQALNGVKPNRLRHNVKTDAVKALMRVTRPLSQQEVDELIKGIAKYSYLRDIEPLRSLAERGYAPSPGIENDLVGWYKNSNELIEIQRMQPHWHAIRLNAEMLKLTPTNATESDMCLAPGL